MEIKDAIYWVKQLQMLPHPEGGYYKETYRSANTVQRTGEHDLKSACTSIYYLLEGEDYSGFHRIKSDELWYFHKGVPLHIHFIDEFGIYHIAELSDSAEGSFSTIVKAGYWFASELPSKTGFALVSCAVAPGFEFTEFEMAKKAELVAQYPEHADLISRLCRD